MGRSASSSSKLPINKKAYHTNKLKIIPNKFKKQVSKGKEKGEGYPTTPMNSKSNISDEVYSSQEHSEAVSCCSSITSPSSPVPITDNDDPMSTCTDVIYPFNNTSNQFFSEQTISDPSNTDTELRLPLRRNACVVCRVCFLCSRVYGTKHCWCPEDERPRRGKSLPAGYTDSRSISFNLQKESLRNFTIDWIIRNADKAYGPLYYLPSVPSASVDVCRHHFTTFLNARSKLFPNEPTPKLLIAGTEVCRIWDMQRAIVKIPQKDLEYRDKHPFGQRLKRVFPKETKMDYVMLPLDTLIPFRVDRRKPNLVTASTNNLNHRRKGRKIGSEEDNQALLGQSHITVSVWNAPSKNLLSCYKDAYQLSRIDHKLKPIAQFAPDSLILSNIEIHMNERLNGLYIALGNRYPECDLSSCSPSGFTFHNNINLLIEDDIDIRELVVKHQISSSHIDLYCWSHC
ncbi:hypothetical protein BDB01DRAFT_772384 [Pilobolus umbonatus]|nr:hypothetical protein BDB01DRAFT_772384 [Pilobolus umbonatus]